MTYDHYKYLVQIMCTLETDNDRITHIQHNGDGVFEITVDGTSFLSGFGHTSLYQVVDGEVKRLKTISTFMS